MCLGYEVKLNKFSDVLFQMFRLSISHTNTAKQARQSVPDIFYWVYVHGSGYRYGCR